MKRFHFGLAAFSVLTASVGAQDIIQEYHGPAADSGQGRSFAPIGDIDGDGIGDLIAQVGGTLYPNGGIRAISGLDGTLLWDAHGGDVLEFFGLMLGGGEDLSGDGVPDIVVGIPGYPSGQNIGRVEVVSGVDGTVLYTLDGEVEDGYFGISSDRIADLDGDGVEDLLIGSQYFNIPDYDLHPNRLYVFSGRDGTLIHRVESEKGDISFSVGITSLGDLDGDGLPEFATTSELRAEAMAFSGADGSLVRTWSEGSADLLVHPLFIDDAGDLDGDGVSDVLVGAFTLTLDGSRVQAPAAIAFSGATSSTLWFQIGASDDDDRFPVYQIKGVGDINQDGIPDAFVAKTLPFLEQGSAQWLSGRGGQPLYRFEGSGMDLLGADLEAMGDVNGDGFPDAAFSIPGRQNGVIRVVSGAEYFLSAEPKNPVVGDLLKLSLAQSDPAAPTLLVVHELDGVPLDFAILGVVAADAMGARLISGAVPPVLQGRQLGLRAYAMSGGAVRSSTTEYITIQ